MGSLHSPPDLESSLTTWQVQLSKSGGMLRKDTKICMDDTLWDCTSGGGCWSAEEGNCTQQQEWAPPPENLSKLIILINFTHNLNISTTAMENVIEELQRENAELQQLLCSMFDSKYYSYIFNSDSDLICQLAWWADCTRQHQETLDAIQATANVQVLFNVQGIS